MEPHVRRIQALACSISAQLYCGAIRISHAARTDRWHGLGNLPKSAGRVITVQVQREWSALGSSKMVERTVLGHGTGVPEMR